MTATTEKFTTEPKHYNLDQQKGYEARVRVNAIS